MSLKFITFNNLNYYANEIRHFSSTRKGGVSTGEFASLNLGNYSDDSRENIDHNRQLLCNELNIPMQNLIGAHQVHSAKTILIDKALLALPESERKVALEGFDALLCNIPGIYITVATADCVPILLYDPIHKAVAAIHSGWKGTLENITGNTIDHMQKAFKTDPGELVAAIGPCIGSQVYEVGKDLYDQFESKGFPVSSLFESEENDKFLFYIRMAVFSQLMEKGVSNIYSFPYCTYSNPELFFSARRQGIRSGRMLTGIGIIE